MKKGANCLLCLLVLVAGCGESFEPPAPQPRPVSFVTLRSVNPGATTRFAGTVDTWKRVELSFEVPGRIVEMMEPGTDIESVTVDVNGKVLAEGTVIARLDDERYRIALGEREAQLAAAKAKASATRIELESVLPEKLKAAKADVVLQEQEVERYRKMVAQKSAPQARLDQIEAAYKVAKASVAETEAVIVTKSAELDAHLAQARIAEESVKRARLDLDDCRLIAPFSGQIARTHVISGGYVLRALPVMTVQMMDPIKVLIAVSPAVDKTLNYNDRVTVYLTDSDETLEGTVYLKDTFADPATRTYLVTLLVRNRNVAVGEGGAPADADAPRATDVMLLQKKHSGVPGPYFTEVGTLYEDESGFYVWKAEGLTAADLRKEYRRRVKVRKVRVTPGDELLDLVQLYTLRELEDHGELDPVNDLILRNVTGDVSDGTEVTLVRKRWFLRPGDIVKVDLEGGGQELGFYVPEDAIQFDGERYHVFALEGEEGAGRTAVKVEVRIGEAIGGLQRLDPVTDGALAEGSRIIVDGAHYVSDGEEVNPVEEVEATP